MCALQRIAARACAVGCTEAYGSAARYSWPPLFGSQPLVLAGSWAACLPRRASLPQALCVSRLRVRVRSCGAALSHPLHFFISSPRTCHVFSAERGASTLRCLRADRVRRGGFPPSRVLRPPVRIALTAAGTLCAHCTALEGCVGPRPATGTGSALSPRPPSAAVPARASGPPRPLVLVGAGPCACRAIHPTRDQQTAAAAAAARRPRPTGTGRGAPLLPAADYAALHARAAPPGRCALSPLPTPMCTGSRARDHSEQWLREHAVVASTCNASRAAGPLPCACG